MAWKHTSQPKWLDYKCQTCKNIYVMIFLVLVNCLTMILKLTMKLTTATYWIQVKKLLLLLDIKKYVLSIFVIYTNKTCAYFLMILLAWWNYDQAFRICKNQNDAQTTNTPNNKHYCTLKMLNIDIDEECSCEECIWQNLIRKTHKYENNIVTTIITARFLYRDLFGPMK